MEPARPGTLQSLSSIYAKVCTREAGAAMPCALPMR